MQHSSISAFDIIKVGVGPSSSHTMGPWNAALYFIEYLTGIGVLEQVKRCEVYLYGSLAKTGKGHGTDVAALLGLTGEDFKTIDCLTIFPKYESILGTGKLFFAGKVMLDFDYSTQLHFVHHVTREFHPNGMTLVVLLQDGSKIEKTYYSVGGGFVVEEGGEDEHVQRIVTPYPCHTAQAIADNCASMGLRVSELVRINEQAWRTEEGIRRDALHLWKEMKACIYRGTHNVGFLPGGLEVRRRAADMNEQLLGGRKFANEEEWVKAVRESGNDFLRVNQWVSCFALAVNEENASFGRIITAPTNGAAGVVPAVLMYAWCFVPGMTEDKIIDFICVAGELGTLFKKNATISAAMGGCQAEIGVSSSMSAGALTDIMGGTPDQVLMAAEIAMEHHLGLTCDPIGGLVQIPCIERNTMGAMKAITAANLALSNNPTHARVSLDSVIKTMWETALDMNSKYKETSEGGLAIQISVNVPEC